MENGFIIPHMVYADVNQSAWAIDGNAMDYGVGLFVIKTNSKDN